MTAKLNELVELVNSEFEIRNEEIISFRINAKLKGPESVNKYNQFCLGFIASAQVFLNPEDNEELWTEVYSRRNKLLTQISEVQAKADQERIDEYKPMKECFESYFRKDKSDAWSWTGWAVLPTIKADRTRKYKNDISVIYVHENGDETRAIMTQTRFNELVAKGEIEL